MSKALGKSKNARLLAVQILSQLLQQQGSLASLLPNAIAASDLSPYESSLVKQLCFGCCRWQPLLAEILKQLLKQALKKKDSDIQALLLLGIYQLEFMRTPDHAVIYESVNLVTYFNKLWAKKFVNAVLRRYQREAGSLLEQAKKTQPYAHPQWLVSCIRQAWPQQAETILEANNQQAPMTLRCHAQRATPQNYMQHLQDREITASLATISPYGLYLRNPVAVEQLPSFTEGVVSVQDEAAQLAADLLELAPGQRVLDACAAPGGKTAHIAEIEPQLAHLTALDSEQRRLDKVHDNLQRTQIHHTTITVDVICADATQTTTWWDGQMFDRILCDVPCSATGIIRRQPDIKLLRQAAHIAELTQLQYQLLSALWPLLVNNGILLYATCSILPEENDQLIQQFLTNHEDARIHVIDASWGLEQSAGRQLLPMLDGHDGFYYARLIKVNQ